MEPTPLSGGREDISVRLRYGTRPTHIARAISICAFAMIVIASYALSSNKAFADRAQTWAALSDSVSLRSQAGKSSWVSLSDGREVLTDYKGASPLRQALEQNQVRPLALATGDFDKDGAADLIGSFAGPQGGIITLHRGNLDSIYPNSLEAQMRKSEGTFSDAPFLSPAQVFALPVAADLLGAGDFDADANLDLVIASRGGERLYLLAGDGRGGFQEIKEISLPGRVTALQIGDVNRRDGLEDIAVCVMTSSGAQALIFEGPEGALRAAPEAFSLPGEANGIALGQLNVDGKGDIVVAASRELIVIEGRDRKLSLDISEQVRVSEARVSRRVFGFRIRSVEIGDFTGRRQADVALLSDEGAVVILSRLGQSQQLSKWNQERIAGGGDSRMIKAGVSSLPADDLLILGSRNIRIITHTRREREDEGSGGKAVIVEEGQREEVRLDAEDEPVAAIGMRLNGDAIDDLVMLVAGRSAVVVAPSVNGAIITVNTNLDNNSRDSVLTLREAILISNGELSVAALTAAEQGQVVGVPGPMDVIQFNIPGTMSGSPTVDKVTLAAASPAGGWVSPAASIYKYLMIAFYVVGDWLARDVEASGAAALQACSYTVTPSQQNFTARAGTGSVTVITGDGCGWVATSNDPWITITSGSSGAGTGVVGYSVTANTGPGRVGTLTVAGQTVTVTQAIVNEWITNGPFGGSIQSLAIDPNNPSTVYAATTADTPSGIGHGVFKSTNGGGSWTAVNNGLALTVLSLAIDPSNTNTVYAGTATGAYKTTNGGSSWTRLNGAFGGNVNTIAIDPSPGNTNILYFATNAGAFKSTNGGTTWSPINMGLGSNAILITLAIDPNNTSTLYAGSNVEASRGVARSTDGGANWVSVTSNLTNPYVNVLAIDPNTSTLYVGTGRPGEDNGEVFKSTNGGASWNPINNGLTNSTVRALAIDPANPNDLYAGTGGGGIFKTTNGGGSWNAVNTGLTNLSASALAIDPTNTSILYAGTLFNIAGGAFNNSGMFKSGNGGGSWSPINNGLFPTKINSIAADSTNPSTLYAGTDGGVLKSTNGGGSWSPVNNGLANPPVLVLAINPASPNTIYAGTTGSGIFKTTNGGNSWIQVNTGLTIGSVFALAIDPVNTNIIYAAGGGGIFKSTNGGGSWNAVNNGLGGQPSSLAIDPVNTNILYTGTGGGLFKSVNGGGNWFLINPASDSKLVIDPSDTNTIYANFDIVSKSTNGGSSWSSVNTGLQAAVFSLAIDPVNTSTLYAGAVDFSGGKVFKSTNGGESWGPVNTGMPSSLTINAGAEEI